MKSFIGVLVIAFLLFISASMAQFTPYTWSAGGLPPPSGPIYGSPFATNATFNNVSYIYVFYALNLGGGATPNLAYQRYTGGFWSGELRINFVNFYTLTGQLAAIQFPGDNQLYLMYLNGGSSSIVYLTSSDGVSWSGPSLPYGTSTFDAKFGPTLGFYTNVAGGYTLFHTYVNSVNVIAWSLYLNAPGSWSPPEQLPEQQISGAATPNPFSAAQSAVTNLVGFNGPLLLFNPGPTSPANSPFYWTLFNPSTTVWTYQQQTTSPVTVPCPVPTTSISVSQFTNAVNGQQVILTYQGDAIGSGPVLNYAQTTPWGPFVAQGAVSVSGVDVSTYSAPSSVVFNSTFFVFYSDTINLNTISYVSTK